MKMRTIRIVVLAIVFLLSVVGFSVILNRGKADMTADMGGPTLPTVSFRIDGNRINALCGHVNEMDMLSLRNETTPLDASGNVKVSVDAFERDITSFAYTLYKKDGETVLIEKAMDEVPKTISLPLADVLGDGESGFLCVQLGLGEKSVYYYTRVVHAQDAAFPACMTFVKKLHEDMLANANLDEITSLLETNLQVKQSLQHVTIQSKPEHVMWAKLKPKVVGNVHYQVQETKSAYTSVMLRYLVQCNGDDSEGALYDVEEFFKVRCVGDKQYLLAYDRTMTERFTGAEATLTSQGISLGMVDGNVSYKTNQDGTVIAFVQGNELWSYQEQENEYALIFSFADAEKDDLRNLFKEHSVRILAMNDAGDITFAVYGYMNRGDHEGESGAAIYYFDLQENTVKEVAFIPSNKSYVAIAKELGEIAFYNSETYLLSVVAGSCLYEINLETNEKTVLLDALQTGAYVSSQDGQMIAYQEQSGDFEVVVRDFGTGQSQTVRVADKEVLVPLGFINKDFVYGVAKPKDYLKTATGEKRLGMYKIEICSFSGEVLKTYQTKGIYILDAVFDGNRVNLHCARKSNGSFRDTADDYISNTEVDTNNISLQTYWSEVRGDLYRLTFEEGLSNRKAHVLKPKQVLQQRNTKVAFDVEQERNWYQVLGLGKCLGVYEKAGDAIAVASKVSGVVVSPEQNYVWEADNRESWYRNYSLDSVVAKLENGIGRKTPAEILQSYNGKEVACITGCSVADLRYLIDKHLPVIAMTDNEHAVVLIGFDAETVVYVNPADDSTATKSFAKFDEMIADSGNTFFACLNEG